MDRLIAWLTPEHTLLLTGCIAVLWMLAEYLHRKRKLAALLLGTGSGTALLLLAHVYGDLIGMQLPLTVYTVSVAVVLGIPGVLLLAVMQILM